MSISIKFEGFRYTFTITRGEMKKITKSYHDKNVDNDLIWWEQIGDNLWGAHNAYTYSPTLDGEYANEYHNYSSELDSDEIDFVVTIPKGCENLEKLSQQYIDIVNTYLNME